MGYRIHTAHVGHIVPVYTDHPETYFDDEEMQVGRALVLDDPGNLEALTLLGDPDSIALFAFRILRMMRPDVAQQIETAMQQPAVPDRPLTVPEAELMFEVTDAVTVGEVEQPTKTLVRVYHRYAEWKEDAILTTLPADIDPTDNDAVQAWALESYDDLYSEAKEAQEEEYGADTAAEIEWEDEFKADLDFPEDEYVAEILSVGTGEVGQ